MTAPDKENPRSPTSGTFEALLAPTPIPHGQTDEIVASIPLPILRLLILFAKPIALLRKTVEVLSWTSQTQTDSWLLLGCWWALCLGGRAAWTLFLPPLLLIPFIPLPATPSLRPPSVHLQPPLIHSSTTPATTQTILLTLSHLHAIDSTLAYALGTQKQKEWILSWKEIEVRRLVRGGLILWGIWMGINFIIGGRATLALVGSAIILASSPALRSMYALLSRSLFIRRLAALIFLFIFGSPPQPPSINVAQITGSSGDETPVEKEPFSVKEWLSTKWKTSRRPSFAFRLRPDVTSAQLEGSAIADENDSAGQGKGDGVAALASPPLYFRFELQENQRWWMGLDWTSALLPQERPSWCDAYLNPASPPSSFVLPGESVMFLPEPKKGDPTGRTKRVSKWRWLDEDWSVVKKTTAGATASGNINPSANPNSSVHNRSGSVASIEHGYHMHEKPAGEESKKGIAEQAFTKGLERLKARTMGAATNIATSASGSPSKRPTSGDYSDYGGDHSIERAASVTGRNSSEERRRASSAASDLASIMNGGGGMGGGVGLGIGGGNANSPSGNLNLLTDLDAQTDTDGWSYGDNKWEGMGARGGMGKYTRRRRWQRRAVCTETVEYIPGTVPLPKPADPAPATEAPKGDVTLKPSVAVDSIDTTLNPPNQPSTPRARSPTTAIGYAVSSTGTIPIAPPLAETIPTTVMTGTCSNSPSGMKSDGGVSTGSMGVRRDSNLGERDQALRLRLKSAMANVGS